MTNKSGIRNQKSEMVLVALGSNLGDSGKILDAAMNALQKFSPAPIRKSSLWQTTPVDCPPGSPKFLNAVVAFAPLAGETPETLLSKLQNLEKEFGRQPKKILNEPRPLDLDLIAFGAETRNSPALTLPHPRAHLRRFVLAPLSEIAPDLVLPGQTQTVAQWLATLPDDASCVKICAAAACFLGQNSRISAMNLTSVNVKSPVFVSAAALVLATSGCSWFGHDSATVKPASTGPTPIVTPDLSFAAKVVSVNVVGRFVVLSFPPSQMPKMDQPLFLYRGGLKVAEVRITGPQQDNNIVADLVSGDAQVGDTVSDK